MKLPPTNGRNEHAVSPPFRDGQDEVRNLLGAILRNSKEACILIRSLSPRRRWELEREVVTSYQAVVLQMNALLRSCTCPPDVTPRQ